MKKQPITNFLAIVITALSMAGLQAQTVINGSFEVDTFDSSGFGYELDLGGSNPLTGWTTGANGVYPWGLQNANAFSGGPTPYGNQWVVVGGGDTWIQQLVSGFIVGETYTLNFAAATEINNGADGNFLEVSFPAGSSTPAEIFETPLRGPNYWDTWGSFSKDFVADSTDVTIRFTGLSATAYDPGVDNVSVTTNNVPDTGSSWVLLAVGGIVLGFARQRLIKG